MQKKILIIDDEPLILDLLKTRLTKSGYEVYGASNQLGFWELAFRVQPDLLIIDVLLGSEGEGTELYEKLVHAGFNSAVPVVFISALIDTDDPPRRPANGDRFAMHGKPFDFEILGEDIGRMLQGASGGGGRNLNRRKRAMRFAVPM